MLLLLLLNCYLNMAICILPLHLTFCLRTLPLPCYYLASPSASPLPDLPWPNLPYLCLTPHLPHLYLTSALPALLSVPYHLLT